MVLRRLLALFGDWQASRPQAPRLKLEYRPARIYAIGDVHGCLDLLQRLEAQIVADAAGAPGDKLIVMVGDLVDRGPSSAQVIDHVLARPPEGFERICLRGNHEAMMLQFLRHPLPGSPWLENGGREALRSYGVPPDALARGVAARALENIVASHVPAEHIEFLEHLPVLLDTPDAIFVHAGLRPGVRLADQSDDDLVWFRDDYANDYAEFGRPVVHGHTPRTEALLSPFRIGIDTGVYINGRLSAVRIMPGEPPRLFSEADEISPRQTRP